MDDKISCDDEKCIVRQTINQVQKDLTAAHINIRDITKRVDQVEISLKLHEAETTEAKNQLRIILDGYETIIHEVRNTRTELETLITRIATDRLEAAERHSKLLKTAMQGVFMIAALTIAISGLYAIVTGTPLHSALLNLIRGLFG